MFMLLLESLYKPDVINNQSIEDLLILMRLAHVYDVDRTLKACQKYEVLKILDKYYNCKQDQIGAMKYLVF